MISNVMNNSFYTIQSNIEMFNCVFVYTSINEFKMYDSIESP